MKGFLVFAYYLKKHHSRDSVMYTAYHEVPREVSLVEVCRLKTINGAGKDISGCSNAYEELKRKVKGTPFLG